jgi:uroporphyrinogen decarboxylase
MLSHRDRVLITLYHREPDRIPVDLGGTQTGILVEPYNALKQALGMKTPTQVRNIVLGLAHIDEAVLQRFDIDIRHVLPGQPDKFHFELLADDSFYDEFGTRWRRPPGGYYYDMVEFPLAACTMEALEKFAWPNPEDPGRVRGVQDELARLRSETDYALEAGLVGLWETCWFTVGLERMLYALTDFPDFVEALMDRTLALLLGMHGAYLDAAGPYLDMVTLWDDYGIQSTSLISSARWRSLVKPRLAELVAMIRSKTGAAIGLHSCGSIVSLLDDLAEIGIQVINPVQVSARNMSPAELKKRYGDRLTFWGGIDTQFLLPKSSQAEVRQAVRDTVNLMAPGGAYILAAVHNIQPGVPPENIVAMFDTAREASWRKTSQVRQTDANKAESEVKL